MRSLFPVFELQLLVIYAITLICQFILKHLNFPVFVSQMLTGLILCSLLEPGKALNYKNVLFPIGSHDILETIGSIGFAFFMFLTGVEIDFSVIKRTGVKPWIIALIGLVTPPAICLQRLKYRRDNEFIYVVLTQTSLSTAVVASLLKELQITNSELGRLALSSVLMPFKDALALALILSTKGIVEVGTYSGLRDLQAIEDDTCGIMMFSIMIISCMVKWSVKYLYDPSRKYACYKKRNIMSLTPHSKLRMVGCIHKQSHIFGMKAVLELCCPTLEQPIIVDAIHLIELVGISNPVFISHHLQRTMSGSRMHNSYSNQVVLAFDHYEHENPGTVTTQTYTAISPPSLMHEDVCQLALDKDASIIILQFHQRWSVDGGIEFDDKNIRLLNCKVLQIAPCSIGILVSRATFKKDSNIRLAMVFVGGKDDREAFFLAKRSTRNPKINLVVYHLVHTEHMADMEDMIDNEALADIRQEHSSLGNVSYRKIIANDGPNTSSFLRDIIKVHDFFIVGRRHGINSPQTNGLGDWSEFSELGVIGDLLASKDFESRASIMVVQQQVKDE
ncbi:hypothetical protein RIF29_29010 [Crotalaria pallida]|uniref:Cation/H+ exchanger domain-containing protein n=1 Tax=Crotalaria pallida TaxID=3830 RepID=A0AAN9EDV6_CROPI